MEEENTKLCDKHDVDELPHIQLIVKGEVIKDLFGEIDEVNFIEFLGSNYDEESTERDAGSIS